jgi:replication-associated recombination protein RarA
VEQLSERYRPRAWADVVGQDEVVGRLKRLARLGWLAGRAYWLSGKSGTGKTSIARLIAAEIAEPLFVTELDAAALTVNELLELERGMASYGWGAKAGRAYLINEAHALRKPAVRQLLLLLERIPRHVVIVFSSTSTALKVFEDSEDAGPLLSRCLRLELEETNLGRPFAEHVRLIAQLEGLDGQPVERYLHLARQCRNNMRAMLGAIELGEMCEPAEPAPAAAESEGKS